jgi:quercetin dioxygenase-like cupin family protein
MDSYTILKNLIDDKQEIPSDSILSRTLLHNDDVRTVLFHFAPGQELSEHTAAKPALLHFLSGEADVTLGEEAVQAGPNTFIYMKAHLPHSIHAKTKVTMLLILLEAGK